MKKFNVVPYVGVGELKFGMSREDVSSILGPADLYQYDEDTGLITDYRYENGLQTLFVKESGRLVMVSLYSNVENVSVGETAINWGDARNIYEDLLVGDPSAKGAAGITVFFKYGVSVAGFHSNGNGDKSLTAFEVGQWRQDDPMLKPVKRTA